MTNTDPLISNTLQGSPATRLCITAWGKLVYLGMFAAAVVLAATGIVGAYIWGSPLPLWLLMIHASFAPVFAISLTLVSLTWADRNRFGDDLTRMRGSTRTLFWIVLVFGLLVVLTGAVPMTPLFGTDGQHFLFYSHKFCAWVLMITVVLHLLSLIRVR